MNIWSANAAAPQWFQTLFPTRPGYLRTTPAPVPVIPKNLAIRRASQEAAAPIAAFWNTYYCGDDWYMDVSTDWVANYLRDPDVIILYAHDHEYNIKATIVSSPVSQAPVVMSHGARIPLRCIEGLCVTDDMRGAGLAGSMIAAADYYTSQSGPHAHMWCRELPIDPTVFTTAASVKTYSYIDGANAVHIQGLLATRIPWRQFQETWNPYRYTTSTYSVIAEVPLNRNNGLDVWNIEIRGRTFIVIVLHTHRRVTTTNKQIFEIIWSSQPNEEVYTTVAAQYSGVVFTTDADKTWKNGWVYGRSGVHATYLYNYLPPVFRNCEFILIREEI